MTSYRNKNVISCLLTSSSSEHENRTFIHTQFKLLNQLNNLAHKMLKLECKRELKDSENNTFDMEVKNVV